jgi:hypothetical protein
MAASYLKSRVERMAWNRRDSTPQWRNHRAAKCMGMALKNSLDDVAPM